MPLIRIDMIEGRSDDEIKALLDATHRMLVAAFNIPERDRYEIVHEHPTSHFVVQDTGLGITRTRNCVVFHITTRPRKREDKEKFYKLLCRELETKCGILPSDVRRIDGHEHGRRLVLRERPRAISDGELASEPVSERNVA